MCNTFGRYFECAEYKFSVIQNLGFEVFTLLRFERVSSMALSPKLLSSVKLSCSVFVTK